MTAAVKSSQKKGRYAAAAASFALGFSSGMAAAADQGGVSMYGRIAGGLDYVSNVGDANGNPASISRYSNSQWGTSLWGINGREDLGGGLAAVIKLESAFDTGSGQLGGPMWGRYSVVGLSSNKYGTLWIGRAMALPDGEVYAIDPMGMQATGAPTLHGNRSWGPRNNAVTYNSPQLGPLTFRLQASLNEPGSLTARLLAGVVTWQDRGLLLKGLYEEIRDRDGNFSNLYGASRLATIGAAYDLGGLKLFLARSQVRSDKSVVVDAENPSAATRQDTTWFGANYQATPALTLIGGAYRAVSDVKGDTGTLLALGANYLLSKQTMLFATTGRVHNGANGVFPVEANGGRPPVGLHQRNAYAGMIYWF